MRNNRVSISALTKRELDAVRAAANFSTEQAAIFEEELEDACEYLKLAEEMPEEAIGLELIGRDEVTHANHLHDILEEHGHEFSEEHKKKWHHVLRKYGFE